MKKKYIIIGAVLATGITAYLLRDKIKAMFSSDVDVPLK